MSRTLRLLFFFLPIYIELALCAFFFDLEETEQSAQFAYTTLVQNFWVGLYTVLVTSLFMILIGFCFRIKKKDKNRLAECVSISQFQKELQKLKSSQSRKLLCGWTLFILISLFCFIYITAFCEVYDDRAQEEWLRSTGFSLFMDMIAFQVAIPVLVGCLGMTSYGCGLKFLLLSIMALIDALRSIRSLVGV